MPKRRPFRITTRNKNLRRGLGSFDGSLGGIPRLRVDENLVANAMVRTGDTSTMVPHPFRRGQFMRTWNRGARTAEEFLAGLAHVHAHAAHELMHVAAARGDDRVITGLAQAHLHLASLTLLELNAVQLDGSEPAIARHLRRQAHRARRQLA